MTLIRRKKILSKNILVIVVLTFALHGKGAFAEDAVFKLETIALEESYTTPDLVTGAAAPKPPPGRASISAGVALVSMYISRGLVYSNKASLQPWTELQLRLSSSEETGGSVGALYWFFGNWNSMQESDPGLGQARSGNAVLQDNWYEADFYTGLRTSFQNTFEASLRFNWYTSPSDSFERIHEIDLRLAVNDEAHWNSPFGLREFKTSPHLRIAKEVADKGGAQQWYIQPSLTPHFSAQLSSLEAVIKFPLVLGFGADGQYRTLDTGENRAFGFGSIGVGVDLPLDLLPKDRGGLTVSSSVDLIVLSDRDLNVRENRSELVSRLGLSYRY